MESVEKRNKFWAFTITGLLVLISFLYYKTNAYYIYLVVYIWFGFAYGVMLQYGRFCFASASRDLFTVLYCYIANRISFSYFVLRLIGFQNPAVYHDSWLVWGNDDSLPVVKDSSGKIE